MGFINDQHYLTTTFVLSEQGMVESMCQLYSVRGDRIEAKFPTDHL